MTGKAATPSVNLSNQSASFFRGFAGQGKQQADRIPPIRSNRNREPPERFDPG